MKKIIMTLVAMLAFAASGKAMSYEQARNEALFLTDKMAYELNLTDEQYEAAYEINLDYLMGVTSYDDVYGTYWERRNLDLSYVLFDWQWELFRAASYFFRPLYWEGGYWHFGIYARYPHRDYFFFGRPVFYASYRGGHAWHRHGGHGYYYGHRDHYHGRPGDTHFGMLDRWNRGDYRNNGHHHGDRGRNHDGGYRNSSTRTTVHGHGTRPGGGNGTRPGGGDGHHHNGGSYGGYRDPNSTTGGTRPTTTTRPTHTLPDRPTSTARPDRSLMNSRPERSTTTSRPSISSDRPNTSHSSRSFSRGSGSSSHSSGSFSRGSGSSSHSSGSFSRGSGSSSHSSGSFSRGGGGGSHSGGGHSSGGGRSFGGRR